MPIQEPFYHISYSSKRFNRLSKNADLKKLERSFGPADAKVIINADKKESVVYFDYLRVFEGRYLNRGITFYMIDGKVDHWEAGESSRKHWYAHLPLHNLALSIPLKSHFRSGFYDNSRWNDILNGKDKKADHGFLFKLFRFLFGFIKVVLLIVLYILLLSIPGLIGLFFGNVFRNNKKLSNERVILFGGIIIALLNYLFWYSVALHQQNSPFIYFIIQLVIGSGFIFAFGYDITNSRCPNCRESDHIFKLGSTFKKAWSSRSFIRREEYRGSTTEETKDKIITTKHYDVHHDEKVENYETYVDHMQCKFCGYMWDKDREKKTGEVVYKN